MERYPQPVVEGDNVTILWDSPLHTDRTTQANRLDIIVKGIKEKTFFIIDMSIPTRSELRCEEFDNISKYRDIEIEIGRIWNLKAMTVPVIKGALGVIKKGFQNNLNKIPGQLQLQEIQKLILTSTAHILRKRLSI